MGFLDFFCKTYLSAAFKKDEGCRQNVRRDDWLFFFVLFISVILVILPGSPLRVIQRIFD